jgi:hypothetical protein
MNCNPYVYRCYGISGLITIGRENRWAIAGGSQENGRKSSTFQEGGRLVYICYLGGANYNRMDT